MILSRRQYLNAVSQYTANIHNMLVINYNEKVNSSALEYHFRGSWEALLLQLTQADASTKNVASTKNIDLLFLYAHKIRLTSIYLLKLENNLSTEHMEQLITHMKRLERRIKRVIPASWKDLQEISQCPDASSISTSNGVDELTTSDEFKALQRHYQHALNSRSSNHQFFDSKFKVKKVEAVYALIKDLRQANSVDKFKERLDAIYADQSKSSEFATLNAGRGLITHYTSMQAKTVTLIDRLYEKCTELEGIEQQQASTLK